MQEAGDGGMNKEHSGLYKGKKASHCYCPSKGSNFGVASGTKSSNTMEKPKGKSRIISLIIPSAKDQVL